MPRVSVVTPVYNGAPFIANNIRSVMAQSYSDWEHIIVDDCSTDGTGDIVRQFPHVNYIRLQKNGGAARALNHGYRAATGSYFAWVSADDGYMPHYLTEASAYLDAHSDAVCVHSGAYCVDPDGFVLRIRNLEAPEPVRPLDLLRRNPIHGASTMFRREVYFELDGFNEDLIASQDTDMWIRMCSLGHIGHIPKPLIFSTRHPNQGSRKTSHLVTQNQLWLADETVRRLGIKALLPENFASDHEGGEAQAAAWYSLALSKAGTSDNALAEQWIRRAKELAPGNLRYRLSAALVPPFGALRFEARRRIAASVVLLKSAAARKSGHNVHEWIGAWLSEHPFTRESAANLAIA